MPNKKEFIAMFKAEAEDLVTKLDKGLVALEKDPHQLDLVKDLNMVAHTLKGAARVFGFRQIQEIAHKIEDIFDKVQRKTLVFDSGIADRIFKGIDRIRILLEKLAKEDLAEVDISDVCQGLADCLSGKPEIVAASSDKKDELPKIEKEIAKVTGEPLPEKHPAAPSGDERAYLAGGGLEDMSGKQNPRSAALPANHSEEYIRVPVSRVNKLLNLVGEVVINKMKTSTKVSQLRKLTQRAREIQGTISSLNEMIKSGEDLTDEQLAKRFGQCHAEAQKLRENATQLLDNFSAEAFHLDPVIEELQTSMKEIKMLPLLTLFEGFPRMVRDIASQKGKEVNLAISGEDTELDKKVLDGMKATLIHILRNAIDHGIEKPEIRLAMGKPRCGTVKLSAHHEAGNVVIRLEDDGAGLDVDEIKRMAIKRNLVAHDVLDRMSENEIRNIVFMNGYSTSPIITDISGRGIGLDIARRDIENLKGQILLESEKGKGTTVTLILPLTIAIIQVLLVKAQGKLFAIPMASITEIINASLQEVSTLDGKMAIQVRDHIIPMVRLDEVLELPLAGEFEENRRGIPAQEISAVIASSLEKKVGFIVDEIVGAEEVFIKSLGAHLGKVKNVSGATILGSGEVVIVLDVEDLLANSRLSHPAILGKKTTPMEKRKEKRILVVDDALSTRELEKSILESQGYVVEVAIDGMDGLDKMTQSRFDLIVTDIQMPRMDGFQFCLNLKKSEQYRDIPVVIVTALEKEEDKRLGIEVGAAAYIVKTSFDQSSLLDTIERLIG